MLYADVVNLLKLQGQIVDDLPHARQGLLHVPIDAGRMILGRQALTRLKEAGVQRRLVGFIMQERGVPRAHYQVKHGNTTIGEVTSGTMSPSLQQAIGTALVQTAHAKVDSEFAIDIRNKAVRARVVPSPFVPRRVKR